MIKLFFFISILFLNACAVMPLNSRDLSSDSSVDPNKLPRVDWQIQSTNLNLKGLVYTPFFVNGEDLTLYSGGYGSDPKNGVLRLDTTISGGYLKERMVLKSGPDLKNYNYFRAPRVAKSGSELWMLAEISGCYEGCDSSENPKSLGVYHSTNDGLDWKFIDYVKVDGSRYVAKWFGHVGLVYNPSGSLNLNLTDLAKNRFITIGEDRNIFVSADGVNYKSIPMKHPFPKDRLVFASMAKTPYGFHLMSNANWSDSYYTTTVRHLFSKDLINWNPIESNAFLKNPKFYKGIHLSYDEKADKLWAVSPCGTNEGCGFVAWVKPKNFLDTSQVSNQTDFVPVGEFVYIKGQTAMIIDKTKKAASYTYKVRLADGTYDLGYTKEMMTFPLSSYKRQGCIGKPDVQLCVGDTIYVNKVLATVMGYFDADPAKIKFAIKFVNTGIVDTGYTRAMIALP